VSLIEQLIIDRDAPALEPLGDEVRPAGGKIDERPARSSLRVQVARLERDLATIVADGFPHILPATTVQAFDGPRLLGLGALERLRDELAGNVEWLRARVAERVEHECRARELLELMTLEPERHKFLRLPVRDLGQGSCGIWEVRPRLGLIGMLAGWWQLKLSSGCPLPKGVRPRSKA